MELLRYNHETGLFTRLNAYGSKPAGSAVGVVKPDGYVYISLCGKRYLAHRLAFLYMTGELPDLVDHIDGDKGNNSWSNLRPATKSQNSCNTGSYPNSLSGVKGVYWHERTRSWRVAITVNGKAISVGYFQDKISAVVASRKAREKYHGEFANHGI